jgi:hypothetical protein
MSANRTARNEAWIVSLVLHAGLLAAVVAIVARPREQVSGPITVRTRDTGHEIGVVLLDEPASRSVQIQPIPLPVPDNQIAPLTPAVQPTPEGPIQPVEHRAPVENRPNAPALGSPDSKTPGAHDPGSPKVEVYVAPVPGPSLPPGTATEFFGVPAVGTSVVFVLDRSASMGLDGRLDRARHELADSLRQLPPTARFQVIAYNKAAEPVRVPGTYGLLPATPVNVAAAIVAVGSMPAEGGTDHRQALQTALALGPDVIYFLTDEDDLEPRDVQAVTRLNHNRVSIHALCLVPPSGGEMPMQMLARGNRGAFKVVK